jgi:hypothetical protein
VAIDDPIAILEQQLVGAARRRIAPRRRTGAGVLAIAASALVALAVAAGALALLGGRSQPASPSVTAAPSSRQQLVGLLAVLRRPQTKADLAPVARPRPRAVEDSLHGTPDRPLIRLAAVAPWGARIYLVPFKPLTGRQLAHFNRPFLAVLKRRAAQGEQIVILARGAPPGGGTVATIRRGQALAYVPLLPGGRPRRSLRMIEVVPDGVARVSLAFAPRAGKPGALIATVGVHGNTAAFQVVPGPPGPLMLTWLGGEGQVLERVSLPAR